MKHLGRRRTGFRMAVFGSDALLDCLHYPMENPAHLGFCACGWPLGHFIHGKAGKDLSRQRGKVPSLRRRGRTRDTEPVTTEHRTGNDAVPYMPQPVKSPPRAERGPWYLAVALRNGGLFPVGSVTANELIAERDAEWWSKNDGTETFVCELREVTP